MKKSKPLKLNLGSGSNKIDGFINIDAEASCNPDILCDFQREKLPYRSDSVEEVVFFHCIEHISKHLHKRILLEIWRVLKPQGRLIISYPEFSKCVDNWKENKRGKKDFWEATIFGRQLYPCDHHVCIMHTPDFVDILKDCGFTVTSSGPEPQEDYNTVVYALKSEKPPNYEDLVKDYSSRVKLKKVKK